MRWRLLRWILMTVLVCSSAVEAVVNPLGGLVDPADPTHHHNPDFDQEATQANKTSFYELGPGYLALPEFFRNSKAGTKTSRLQAGPIFSKEFMLMTPSEKRATTEFKLLDWKRRRKRCGKRRPTRFSDNSRAGGRCGCSKDKVMRSKRGAESNSKHLTTSDKKERTTEGNSKEEDVKDVTIRDIEDEAGSSKSKDQERKSNLSDGENNAKNVKSKISDDVTLEVERSTTPLTLDKNRIHSIISDCVSKLEARPKCSKCVKESKVGTRCKSHNKSSKRGKREKEPPFADLIDYEATTKNDECSNVTEEHICTSALSTTEAETLTFSSTFQTEEPLTSTTDTFDTTTETLSVDTSTIKPDYHSGSLSKKEISDEEDEKQCELSTDGDTVSTILESLECITSKAKAKIIIGEEEIPVRTLTKEQETKLEHNSGLFLPNQAIVFAACVTPPPSTTSNPIKDLDHQRAECHPKGSGPLSPILFDPEAYGPRNEEEVEDAMTGKLADRVVEVVLAKVGKAPRMMKELGLYAQGNLTKIQCSVSHPEGKQTCKEMSSDALKMSVLEDIAAAVEKLASTKTSGLCLKPPDDLADFLTWLLSEDSEMDMPEPSHLYLQPRREADYLFRSNGAADELLSKAKDVDRKCNWDAWMSFVEDPVPVPGAEKAPADEFEGKGHVKPSRNFKRTPRHLSHRKRTAKKAGEHGRRRRYTPWSLSDYP